MTAAKPAGLDKTRASRKVQRSRYPLCSIYLIALPSAESGSSHRGDIANYHALSGLLSSMLCFPWLSPGPTVTDKIRTSLTKALPSFSRLEPHPVPTASCPPQGRYSVQDMYQRVNLKQGFIKLMLSAKFLETTT